jgi:5'-AMP-activated protein kinase regulatory gamma subunit
VDGTPPATPPTPTLPPSPDSPTHKTTSHSPPLPDASALAPEPASTSDTPAAAQGSATSSAAAATAAYADVGVVRGATSATTNAMASGAASPDPPAGRSSFGENPRSPGASDVLVLDDASCLPPLTPAEVVSPRLAHQGALFAGSAPWFRSENPDSPQRLLSETGHKHHYTSEKPITSRPKNAGEASPMPVRKVDFGPDSPNSAPQSKQGRIDSGRALMRGFFESHTCFDMMPNSSKVIAFDTQLQVKKAFYALVQNGMRAAILWDSAEQQYCGMITVTDFIQILRRYYVSPLVKMGELEDHKIQTWRDINILAKKEAKAWSQQRLVAIDPMTNLLQTHQVLLTEKVHRLPIIDNETGNAFAILTHLRLLTYLHSNFLQHNKIDMFELTLSELNLGTKTNVAAVQEETPLISVLNIFCERRISALPVVDQDGRVISLYRKHDVMNLARDRTYNNLDVSVSAALKRRKNFHALHTCRLTDTLGEIIEKIVVASVHRLVIVDREKFLIGVVSLSDLLEFMLNTPGTVA